MPHSRRSVLSLAFGVGAGVGVQSTLARAGPLTPAIDSRWSVVNRRGNQITVGVGRDFSDVASALASITDNTADNPYAIVVQPGTYGAFAMKPYVDIRGAGPSATVIETKSDAPVVASAYCS